MRLTVLVLLLRSMLAASVIHAEVLDFEALSRAGDDAVLNRRVFRGGSLV